MCRCVRMCGVLTEFEDEGLEWEHSGSCWKGGLDPGTAGGRGRSSPGLVKADLGPNALGWTLSMLSQPKRGKTLKARASGSFSCRSINTSVHKYLFILYNNTFYLLHTLYFNKIPKCYNLKCYKLKEHKRKVKRWVLRPHLKASTDCSVLRWFGRAFHRLGAAEQKAQSPIVQSLVLGGFRRYVETEWRVRVEHCTQSWIRQGANGAI